MIIIPAVYMKHHQAIYTEWIVRKSEFGMWALRKRT